MPNLLFITVPTDKVMNKAGDRVRFPGTDAALAELKEAGWEIHQMTPDWPKPMNCLRNPGLVQSARFSMAMLSQRSQIMPSK